MHIPPTKVPGISRFSVVADPQMATFVLFKVLSPPRSTGRAGRPGSVGWHELISSDPEKAFAFYRELFGWEKGEVAVEMETYQSFSVGGQTIGGMFTKPPMVPVAFRLYYFSVGDIDAPARRVKTSGGRILEGPCPIEPLDGNRVVARCTDPQGAMFALTGKRSDRAVGYFEPATADDPPPPGFSCRVGRVETPRRHLRLESFGSAPRPSAN